MLCRVGLRTSDGIRILHLQVAVEVAVVVAAAVAAATVAAATVAVAATTRAAATEARWKPCPYYGGIAWGVHTCPMNCWHACEIF